MRIVSLRSFQGVITSNLALAILSGQRGVIDILNLNFFSDAVGTLKFYLASLKESANAAVAADTALTIDTDTDGFVGDNAVVTTNDKVIVLDSTAPSGQGLQLRGISAVAAVSSSTVLLTLDANITCKVDDVVYIVRSADIVSRATTDDERTTDAKDQASSKDGFPIAIEVSATGTNELSGKVRVVDFSR